MQFKLLQTYKILSNFAISLIMEFIPFIILDNARESFGLWKALMIMFGYWALQNLFVVIFHKIFKKQYFKRPQLFLLLRIIPIVLCEICIIFLATNNIFVIMLTAIFSGMEISFNYVPVDIIYNYVSEGEDEKTLGFTRFLEQAGYFVAGICGGLFLDYINPLAVVIFSLIAFVGSAIPLFVFYFKFKNSPNFNTDFICSIAAKEEQSEQYQKLKKSYLRKHFVTNLLLAPMIDSFYYLASTVIYLKTTSYFVEGLVNSLYDGLYGLSCLLIGKLLTKVDGKNYATIAGLAMIVASVAVVFAPNMWIACTAFVFCAIIRPFVLLHLYQEFLDKGRILGVGNDVVMDQSVAEYISYSISYVAGVFGGLLIPTTIVTAAMALVGVFVARHTEKSTTEDLVDYLEKNENKDANYSRQWLLMRKII